MTTYNTYVSVNDTIVSDILKIVGRKSFSEVSREALSFYYEKITNEKYTPYCLPKPTLFTLKLKGLSDEEISYYESETCRLHNLVRYEQALRKLESKQKKELTK